MDPPNFTPWNTASNATNMLNSPMVNGIEQQFTMPVQPQPFPFMMMHPQLMQPPGFPMFPFPNFPMMAYQQPFFSLNQLPVVPSPQSTLPQLAYAASSPSSTPCRVHNTSLNASLLGGSTSFNDSVRFNPIGRGRSRDHSLVDQNSSGSAPPFPDSRSEFVANSDILSYLSNELNKTPLLTEEELVAKVSKSRRFKKFAAHTIPEEVSTVLKTYSCFNSRTVLWKTSPDDLQPVLKTLYWNDTRYQGGRVNQQNVIEAMFEILERNTERGGEVFSVLEGIEPLKIDEKKFANSVLEGIEPLKIDEREPADSVLEGIEPLIIDEKDTED